MFPYTGFDPLKNQLLDIKVSQLILMDTTLTSNPNIKLEDAYNIALDLKINVKKSMVNLLFYGIIVILSIIIIKNYYKAY